jgi:SAM-dependent MidA family methyltransferase
MSRNILPEPSEELKPLSQELCARIRNNLESDGMMPFSAFMEMALYEPGLGYYSAGLHKLGASGDFITSPELGSLFAACLAAQVAETGQVLGKYDILEIGAGTGRLATDLLMNLLPDQLPARYLILERSADLREVQRQQLASAPEISGLVEWLDEPPSKNWQGVLLANEVLDALAVERFQQGENEIEQLCVTMQDTKLAWAFRKAPAELERAVSHLAADTGRAFSTGYRSEINLLLNHWLSSVTARMTRGLALFIDYGYPRKEYYLLERNDGTLMCHYRHRAHDDPFFWPGLQDITAWVDFTALAEAADASALDVEGYTSQTMFLLGCGLDRLLMNQGENDDGPGASLSAEARQLTLPGMMGEKFQVMGLGRGLEATPRGFSLQDLRHRL